jgi:hypothetical protein
MEQKLHIAAEEVRPAVDNEAKFDLRRSNCVQKDSPQTQRVSTRFDRTCFISPLHPFTGCPAWPKSRTFETNPVFSEGEAQGNSKVSQKWGRHDGPAAGFQVINSLHSLQPPWMKPRPFEAKRQKK